MHIPSPGRNSPAFPRPVSTLAGKGKRLRSVSLEKLPHSLVTKKPSRVRYRYTQYTYCHIHVLCYIVQYHFVLLGSDPMSFLQQKKILITIAFYSSVIPLTLFAYALSHVHVWLIVPTNAFLYSVYIKEVSKCWPKS